MGLFSRIAIKIRWLLVVRKMKVFNKFAVFSGVEFVNPQKVTVGSRTVIRERVWIAALKHEDGHGKISIGEKVHLARDSIISSAYNVTVGREVTFGPHAIVMDNNHGFHNPEMTVMRQGLTGSPVTIGDYAWLGANSVVLPGVSVGKGAIVAAGAIVARDVPPYTIVGGVPAKAIGTRNH